MNLGWNIRRGGRAEVEIKINSFVCIMEKFSDQFFHQAEHQVIECERRSKGLV